jgi:hypothetical protein
MAKNGIGSESARARAWADGAVFASSLDFGMPAVGRAERARIAAGARKLDENLAEAFVNGATSATAELRGTQIRANRYLETISSVWLDGNSFDRQPNSPLFEALQTLVRARGLFRRAAENAQAQAAKIEAAENDSRYAD